MKIDGILDKYNNTPDLIVRKIKYRFKYIYIFYIETICSSEEINDFILKNITNPNKFRLVKDILAGPNLNEIDKSEIDDYLFSGFSIIVYKKNIYALETKANLSRSISSPSIEPDLHGAKDSLIENYQVNIGLIKRRIKSSHLKIKDYKLGKYSQSIAGLMYIDDIVNMDLVNKCNELINKIDTDAIIDVGELKQFLIEEGKSFFPSAKLTERPDTIVHALLNGKAAIFVDNSPFAIIIPAVLADFINPVSDTYLHSSNVNFIKVLRLICFFISILAPAYYVAIINYNQETIPSKLLTSFITQRQGVPFPAPIEAFFMLFICEMLKESDVRFPSNYGSSISILGALILGEAAVSASIVSPIMIIVISLTYISNMIFNNVEMGGALRTWRFIALLLASFYGLFGIAIIIIVLTLSLSSFSSFNLPYTFPVAPYDKSYLKNTLIKGKKKFDTFRSKYLTKNIRKQSDQ